MREGMRVGMREGRREGRTSGTSIWEACRQDGQDRSIRFMVALVSALNLVNKAYHGWKSGTHHGVLRYQSCAKPVPIIDRDFYCCVLKVDYIFASVIPNIFGAAYQSNC
jgi:hypothetical protein